MAAARQRAGDPPFGLLLIRRSPGASGGLSPDREDYAYSSRPSCPPRILAAHLAWDLVSRAETLGMSCSLCDAVGIFRFPVLIQVVQLDPDRSVRLVVHGTGAIYLEIIRLLLAPFLQFGVRAFVELARFEGHGFAPYHRRSRRELGVIGRLRRAVALVSSNRRARILNDGERRRGPGGHIRTNGGPAVGFARAVLVLLGSDRRACQR